MLRQAGTFTAHQNDSGVVNDRVMDSNDLEREKRHHHPGEEHQRCDWKSQPDGTVA